MFGIKFFHLQKKAKQSFAEDLDVRNKEFMIEYFEEFEITYC
ncbi:MAG: hypothetical protein ACYC6P_11130 [Ignavibacteriaceae bacterium]